MSGSHEVDYRHLLIVARRMREIWLLGCALQHGCMHARRIPR